MPWVKGQSGNPGGLSKEVKGIQQLARKHGDAAIAELASLMKKGKSEQTRAFAAEKLLDRGYGKPPTFNTDDAAKFRSVLELDNDTLDALIAAGLADRETASPHDPGQLN